jgi:hypothetical protein
MKSKLSEAIQLLTEERINDNVLEELCQNPLVALPEEKKDTLRKLFYETQRVHTETTCKELLQQLGAERANLSEQENVITSAKERLKVLKSKPDLKYSELPKLQVRKSDILESDVEDYVTEQLMIRNVGKFIAILSSIFVSIFLVQGVTEKKQFNFNLLIPEACGIITIFYGHKKSKLLSKYMSYRVDVNVLEHNVNKLEEKEKS